MSTALITGPTSGLGLAFARALAARRHDLVLVSRDGARLARVAADLEREFGIATSVLAADLGDRAQLTAVEARMSDPTRPIDVLVNNAGFGIREQFAESAVADEQQMLDVMVTAVMRLTHAALPGMVERGHGVVLNVSSVASWIAGGTYSAAKAWVTVFSEGLNGELRDAGVKVTAVCPGFVHTEFHERAHMDMSTVPEWLWLDADDVVAQALRDVALNRPVSVTGLQYKAASTLLQHGPRSLVRAIGHRRSADRARQ